MPGRLHKRLGFAQRTERAHILRGWRVKHAIPRPSAHYADQRADNEHLISIIRNITMPF